MQSPTLRTQNAPTKGSPLLRRVGEATIEESVDASAIRNVSFVLVFIFGGFSFSKEMWLLLDAAEHISRRADPVVHLDNR